MSSARQVLGFVGTVVGSFFGPAGAAIGGIIGGELGGFIDGPPEGPKLEDLSAPAIQYGAKVPWVEGTVWCDLSPLWWSGLRESSETVGGKGGDSGVEQFSYHCDMLGRLCNGANVQDWTRIEIDGEIVATRLADSSSQSLANSAATDRYADVVLLTGLDSQSPWPVYEAAVGAANASAYIGQCTIGFQNLWMKNGRSPSRIRVEVTTTAATEFAALLIGQPNITDYRQAGPIYFDGSGLVQHVKAGYPSTTEALVNRIGLNGTTSMIGAFATSSATASYAIPGTTDAPFSVELLGASSGYTYPGAQSIVATGTFGGAPRFAYSDGRLFISGVVSFNNVVYRFDSGSAPTVTSGSIGTHHFIAAAGESVYVLSSTALTTLDATTLAVTSTIATPGNSQASVVLASESGDVYLLYGDSVAGHTKPMYRLVGGAWTLVQDDVGNLGPDTQANTAIDRFCISGGSIYRYVMRSGSAPEICDAYIGSGLLSPQAEDLQDVLERMALRCRPLTAANIDFSAAAGYPVYGYKYFGSAAASMQPLLTAAYLDMFCDDKLRLVQRGGAIEQTVPFAWSGAGGGDKFAGLIRDNDVEVRKRTAITYINRLSDGETDTVNGERESVGVETETITLAIYMTRSVAQGIADTATWDKRVATHTATVHVGARHGLLIQPGSVVMFADHKGNSYRTLVRRAVLDRWVWTLDVRLDDPGILMAAGIAVDDDLRVIEVATPPEASLLLVDGPMVRDADDSPGLMAVITVTGERTNATLYGSTDNVTFTAIGSVTRSATTGTCTELGTHTAGWLWDEVNTMTVTLGDGMTLSSSTRAAMYANERINCAWVIQADGTVELIRFRTASLIAPQTYLLSGFLRGLKGTEYAIDGHADGDTFVLLADNGLLSVVQEAGEIGALRYFKAVPPGRVADTVLSQEFTSYSERLKPRAPVNLRASLSGGTAVVTWERRSRMSVPPYAEPPLGEASESYTAELLNGSTVVDSQIVSDRTVTFTGASAGYTVSIAQRSAIVGDGHESEITL